MLFHGPKANKWVLLVALLYILGFAVLVIASKFIRFNANYFFSLIITFPFVAYYVGKRTENK